MICRQKIPSSRSPHAQPRRAVVAGEEFSALLDAETERDEDLALGLHPAVVAGLDPFDGRLGDAGFASQLRLRPQRCFPELLNSIHAAPPRAVTQSLRWHRVGSQGTGRVEPSLTPH